MNSIFIKGVKYRVGDEVYVRCSKLTSITHINRIGYMNKELVIGFKNGCIDDVKDFERGEVTLEHYRFTNKWRAKREEV